MNWVRVHAYCWQSDEGYRVAAFRVDGGFRYGAFAPPMDHKAFEDICKAHYALGESVPQQRASLGCFDDPEYAREACAFHLHPPATVMA